MLATQSARPAGTVRRRWVSCGSTKAKTKSKSSCSGCSVKKITCDGMKPSCGRCMRNNVSCSFKADVQEQKLKQVRDIPRNDLLLKTEGCMPLIDYDADANRTSRILLLQHFQNVVQETHMLGDASYIMTLSLAKPYMLDAMLAVSACHLKHHTAFPHRYHVAEHVQRGMALQTFKDALSHPIAEPQSADALLLTAMMFNLLSFAVSADDEVSWVFSKDGQSLGWLSLQMGFKPLLEATKPFREQSKLKWIHGDTAKDSQTIVEDEQPSLASVPKQWRTIFELTDSDTDNIFYEPVRQLASLRRLPSTPDNFSVYLGFLGSLGGDFRGLVENHDKRAMWLLGYWLGLLSRYDNVWWMKRRVTRDYKAIIQWLKMRGVDRKTGELGRLWTQMVLDLEIAPHIDLC